MKTPERAPIAWYDLAAGAVVGIALLLGAVLGASALAQSLAERSVSKLVQFAGACAARPPDPALALACMLAARPGR